MYTLPGRGLHEIPVIETDRIRLRAPRADDFERMFNMWQTPEYYRYIGNQPRNSDEVWNTIQRNIGAWALWGYGAWTIADVKTDMFMGECGFMLRRRPNIEPALPMIPECGWGIRPEYWGQGYMKEAMRAAMHWALEHDRNFPSQCIIDLQNYSSEAVAFAIGMKLSRTISLGAGITNLYQRNYVG